MVLLQYDYKGLRLYGKTRGLTHTDALYLEYIDGVRASPSVKRPAAKTLQAPNRQCPECLGGGRGGSDVPRAIARGKPAF